MNNSKLEELLASESSQLNKLNSIVLQAIEEEKLVSHKLYEFDSSRPDLGSRLADGVARFGGSWKFIITFLAFMALWIAINLSYRSFDPYPFILLNLLLSTVAAIQAPIILMSQNRKEEKDRLRSVNDYMVNLKSEIEIRNMHQKLDLLIADQMKTLFEIQNVQMQMMEEMRVLLRENRAQEAACCSTHWSGSCCLPPAPGESSYKS